MNVDAATVENSMDLPQKTKNRITVSSSNPSPGHRSRQDCNLKRYMHPMFIVTLCPIAKTWRQSKCPSTDELMEKMWLSIATVEHYSAIKRI